MAAVLILSWMIQPLNILRSRIKVRKQGQISCKLQLSAFLHKQIFEYSIYWTTPASNLLLIKVLWPGVTPIINRTSLTYQYCTWGMGANQEQSLLHVIITCELVSDYQSNCV